MVLDVIILIYFAFMCYFSAKKGFIRSLFEIIGYVVAIVAAFFISDTLSTKIYYSYFHDDLILSVTKKIDVIANSVSVDDKIEIIIESLPHYLNDFAQNLNLNLIDINRLDIWMQNGQEYAAIQIVYNVLSPLIIVLIRVAVMLILFIIFSLIVKLIAYNLNNTLGQISGTLCNHIFGMIFGFGKALLVVMVICSIMQIMMGVFEGEFLEKFDSSLNESHIFNSIYKLNPFI